MKKLKKLLIVVLVIVVIVVIWRVYDGIQMRNTTPGGDKYDEISWPTSAIAQLLPVPEDLSAGVISSDREDYLSVYLGKLLKDDYQSYVEQCKEKGFTVDYSSSDDYYFADNSEGYRLSVDYDADRRMMGISISAPVESTPTPEVTPEPSEVADVPDETNTEEPPTEEETSGEVDPEFKTIMDNYETTINNYCDFMEEYNNASAEDMASMLADYTEYLQQYTETIDGLNSIDEDSLSSADLAYYIEVSGRISQRLLEVGESLGE